jgi:hypothetical protein
LDFLCYINIITSKQAYGGLYMQNVVNYPYFICNLTTGKASAFATYAEAEKALILLNTNADAYIIVDTEERCLEEI